MKTSPKKYLSFILFIALTSCLILACTKNVEIFTEVEFEVLGQHLDEGFVNQDLETTITVVPEEELEGFQYSITYELVKGQGYFKDASGKSWDTRKGLELPAPRSTSLWYIGTEPGAHRVRVIASDNFGFSNTIELLYNISNTPENTPPTAQNVSVSFPENTTNNAILLDAQIADIDGDTSAVTISTPPAHGNATVSGTTITYTPNSNYEGIDTIAYTVNDGNGGSAIATISITVTKVNEAPVAVDDTIMNVSNTSSTTFEVLGNDSDPDGNAITLTTNFSQPTYGTIERVAGANGPNSAFRYIPGPIKTFNFTEEFTYTITDGNLVSAPATVSFAVKGYTASFSNGSTVSYNDASRSGTVTITNGPVSFELSVSSSGGNASLSFRINNKSYSVSEPNNRILCTEAFPPGTYNYSITSSYPISPSGTTSYGSGSVFASANSSCR